MRDFVKYRVFSTVLACLSGLSPARADFLPPTMMEESSQPSGGGLAAAMKEQSQGASPVDSLPHGRPVPQGELVAQVGPAPVAAPPSMNTQTVTPAQTGTPAAPAGLPDTSRDETRIPVSSDYRDAIRPLIREALTSTALPAETRAQLQTLVTQDTLTLHDVRTLAPILGRAMGVTPLQSSQHEQAQRTPYLPFTNDRSGVEVQQHRFAAGVAASVAPMRARFEALGGNFDTAQRSLVTPSSQAPIAARIRAVPAFQSAQVYSGRAAMLDLQTGRVSTYVPTAAATRTPAQANETYLTDLSRRNDRGHSPIEAQPALTPR